MERKRGRPPTPPEPTTLKALYQQYTGDTAAHQRAIHGRYLHLDSRRRRLIDLRLTGAPLRKIATKAGITHGAAASAINGALEAIRKDIAQEPRFNGQEKARQAGGLPGSSEGDAPR
jgi:DNA-directed RNA polymerase specialized sigma24 family protein